VAFRLAVAWFFALWLLCSACASEHAARYTTRGVVRAQSGQGEETRIAIHHERLPSFEDREGRRAPMASMTMVFGLAPHLQHERLPPGTKLRFDFEVRWTTPPFLVITRLERLPAITELELTDAHGHGHGK
jgi:hypothetical protein